MTLPTPGLLDRLYVTDWELRKLLGVDEKTFNTVIPI